MARGGHMAQFLSDEDGSATVEWILGTALGVTMALAVSNAVSGGVQSLPSKVSSTIAAIETDPSW